MSSVIADDQEILSGEAVAIDVQPVGFVLRAAGALVDMLLGFALFAGFIILDIWMFSQGLLTEHLSRMLAVAASVVCFLVLPLTVEMATRGRSLGKLIVGGRIVRADGGGITFRHSFIRALIGVLEIYMTFGGAAVITGALTSRSQRLGDLVAGTYSQRVRTPALPQHPMELPLSLTEWSTVADVAKLPDRLARRVSQFLANIDRLSPASRDRLSQELAAEVSAYVSPQPRVSSEELLRGVTALRRHREQRALSIADDRAEKLTGKRIRL